MTISFDEWLAVGRENGWVSLPVCSTHESLPLTDLEQEEFEEGDPCVHVLRLYEGVADFVSAEGLLND